MPAYSDELGFTKPTVGGDSNDWGGFWNTNAELIEEAIGGYVDLTISGNTSLTITDGTETSGSTDQGRNHILKLSGSPAGAFDLTLPEVEKTWVIWNATGQTATVQTTTATATVTLLTGYIQKVFSDGAGAVEAVGVPVTTAGNVDINGGSIDGTPIGANSASTGSFTTLDASGAAAFSGNVDLGDNSADTISVNGTIDTNVDISRSSATAILTLREDSASAGTSGILRFTGDDNAGTEVQLFDISARRTDGTAGAVDSEVGFSNVQTGSFAERMTLAAGLVVGSPTGGDKGAGTINATAVYDDNTLLTCYVIAQAVDGSVDIEEWDATVPDRVALGGEVEDRRHDPMRKFLDRIGTDHDPLTLDGYARHWREKRHLTSLPNEANFRHGDMSSGEWVQRLVETVEIQAVLIEQLNDRTKAQEARIDDLEARLAKLEG